MSIENISRIYTQNDKNIYYIFELPSIEDEEGYLSYSLKVSKDGEINLQKLTDFNDLFQKLREAKTGIVRFKSKEYDYFLQLMNYYLSQIDEKETSLTNEDIYALKSQFEKEINKKGNTEILKRSRR